MEQGEKLAFIRRLIKEDPDRLCPCNSGRLFDIENIRGGKTCPECRAKKIREVQSKPDPAVIAQGREAQKAAIHRKKEEARKNGKPEKGAKKKQRRYSK